MPRPRPRADISSRASQQLRPRPAAPSDDEQRRFRRHHLPADLRVTAEFLHPGGSKASCRVTPLNISLGGIGFHHVAFIHIGTPCRLTLSSKNDAVVRLEGAVARCAFVQGRSHEIGVQFDKPLCAEMLLPLIGTATPTAQTRVAAMNVAQEVIGLLREEAPLAAIQRKVLELLRCCAAARAETDEPASAE